MKSRNRKYNTLSLPWDKNAPHDSHFRKAEGPENQGNRQPKHLEDYLDFLAGFDPTQEELTRTVVFKKRFTLPD
jgi:hypothetical protein